MRSAPLALLAVALLVLGASPHAASSLAACEGLLHVPGQGPSCPVPGGWEVLLRDGTRVTTHGPDHLLPHGHGSFVFPAPVAPACVEATDLEPRGEVIYARAVDAPDYYAIFAPQVKTMVEKANALLRQEAAELGAVREYKMLCSGGALLVKDVILPTPSNVANFATIVSDLAALGHASPLAKYWVWYQGGSVDGMGAGEATVVPDDSPGASNANNHGPGYGVTYFRLGDEGASIMMHENMHNLGAVQHSAPHASGKHHCNDGQDLMCYADGGPASAYDPAACTDTLHVDCGHDDYFHPSPVPGSYLDTHWNVASPVNRFLRS